MNFFSEEKKIKKNKNKCIIKLKKISTSLSEIADVLERMYENESANFANLIRLLLHIKIEVFGDSIWSTSSNFENECSG